MMNGTEQSWTRSVPPEGSAPLSSEARRPALLGRGIKNTNNEPLYIEESDGFSLLHLELGIFDYKNLNC
jgi:hypothetical protein